MEAQRINPVRNCGIVSGMISLITQDSAGLINRPPAALECTPLAADFFSNCCRRAIRNFKLIKNGGLMWQQRQIKTDRPRFRGR